MKLIIPSTYAGPASFLRLFRLCVDVHFALGGNPRLIRRWVVVRLHCIRVLDLTSHCRHTSNLMRKLWTADFAHDAQPTVSTDFSLSNIWLKLTQLFLTVTLFPHRIWVHIIATITWKYHVIHKTWSTKHTVTLPEKNWAMATVNMQRKFREVRLCGFRDMQADRQTDGWTCLSQYFASYWR